MSSARMFLRFLQLYAAAMLLASMGAAAETGGTLAAAFYDKTCPQLDGIVKSMVAYWSNETNEGGDAGAPPALLRLHFHDCFVEGCDGSILLKKTDDNTTKEIDAEINLTLEMFDIIDKIKERLEQECAGVVSCADVLALAAKHSVLMSGGPDVPIRLGRRDGTSSPMEKAVSNLPLHTANASEQIRILATVGLNSSDLITLTGAHTFGLGRCMNIRPDLEATPALDPKKKANLSAICPAGSEKTPLEDQIEVEMDMDSPLTFDNNYYKHLLANRGMFLSDRVLKDDPRTRSLVELYAKDQEQFFRDFSLALIKMSELDVKTGHTGEIRKMCGYTNSYLAANPSLAEPQAAAPPLNGTTNDTSPAPSPASSGVARSPFGRSVVLLLPLTLWLALVAGI